MKYLPCVLLAGVVLGSAGSFLAAQAADPPATAPAGAAANRVEYVRVVHDARYDRLETERLAVTLRLTADPAAQFAFVDTAIHADKAVDERGNSLVNTGAIPADLNGPPNGALGGPVITNSMGGMAPASDVRMITVLLKVPPANVEMGRTIKVLEGAIPAAVATKTDTLTLAIPGKLAHTYPGGVKAAYTAAKSGATMCQISCTFDLPQGMSDAERKIWSGQINALKAKLTGGTGEWMSAGGGSNANAPQISRTMIFVPRNGQGTMPTSAGLDMVVETKATAIPFHFEDIPLP